VQPPTDADNFLLAAEALLDDIEGTAEETAAWDGFSNARSRAAVSRAYYAVFLHIKYRLIRLRSEWRNDPSSFPAFNVHARFIAALRVVRNGRDLSDTLFQLSRSRTDADYVWDSRYSPDHAVGEVELAKALMDDLGRVNDFDWKKVADRLAARTG
jgi:hypothetical protein